MKLLRVPLALLLTLSILACSPATLANYAESVGKYALKTKPIFQSLIDSGSLPNNNILARIDQVSRDSKILADALRAGVHTSILTATAAVINGIEALIEQDAELIKNPQTRAKVIGFLVAAEIAIGIITDSFPDTHHAYAYATQEQKQALETIKKFKAKVRCRMAGTVTHEGVTHKAGQFAKMEMCKKYPDKTVVERIKPR